MEHFTNRLEFTSQNKSCLWCSAKLAGFSSLHSLVAQGYCSNVDLFNAKYKQRRLRSEKSQLRYILAPLQLVLKILLFV